MRNILLFCDTAISHSNIDIRIVTKNIAVHRCTGVSLQPYKLGHVSASGCEINIVPVQVKLSRRLAEMHW